MAWLKLYGPGQTHYYSKVGNYSLHRKADARLWTQWQAEHLPSTCKALVSISRPIKTKRQQKSNTVVHAYNLSIQEGETEVQIWDLPGTTQSSEITSQINKIRSCLKKPRHTHPKIPLPLAIRYRKINLKLTRRHSVLSTLHCARSCYVGYWGEKLPMVSASTEPA